MNLFSTQIPVDRCTPTKVKSDKAICLPDFVFMEPYKLFSLRNLSATYPTEYYPLGEYFLEEWLPINNFESLYQISSFGRIKRLCVNKLNGRFYSVCKEKILRQKITDKGYLSIQLSNNGKSCHFSVHRLVGTHFIINPVDKPEINHINGVKANNFYKNLEWNTPLENKTHAIKTGLINTVGKNNGRAKLNETDVLSIRLKYKPLIYSSEQLAKDYNVSPNTILRIINKETWKHV